MKRIYFTMLLSLAAGYVLSQSLTLDSCYAQAVRNYPLIQQYDLIEKTREYTLNNAGKAYLPQISITGIAGYVMGGFPSNGSAGDDFKLIGLAQVNQAIWDGGATKTQKEIISAGAEAEKAGVEVSMYELRARVNQLYFGILLIDEQLKQLEIRRQVLVRNAQRIADLNENGLAFTTDLQEIEVEQLRLDQHQTELEHTRSGYLQMLVLFTGNELGESSQLEKPAGADMTEMPLSRPELALFQSQRNLAEAQARMHKVSMMPKVGVLGAGVFLSPEVSLGPSSLSSIGVIGLSASWNVSGLYKNSNQKALAQLTLDKIEVQEQAFLYNNSLQTTQIRANIAKQRSVLALDEEIVKLRTSIREGYQEKYDNGMCSMLDLLDATERESEATSQKALHEMQLLMALYEYKTQTGNN